MRDDEDEAIVIVGVDLDAREDVSGKHGSAHREFFAPYQNTV